MCFTVEIDEEQFPDASSILSHLSSRRILFVASRQTNDASCSRTICYKIEIDTEKSLQEVSIVLAELIKQNYLRKHAENIIKSDYISVSINDRADLIDSIIEYTDMWEISSIIFEYAKSSKHMHLGGFVLFRMKEFIRSFEDEIDFAVDEYIERQRHKDFIRFLRFFVSMQESEVDEVNLVLVNNSKYHLLDSAGVPINKNLLDSSYCEISSLEDNSAYLIINDLVSLSPKHIILHCDDDIIHEDVPSLITEIFQNRVSICNSCHICKK